MLGAIVGTIAIVLVTIAVGIWIDRKKAILPRPQDFTEQTRKPEPPRHAAGEAPATAIRANAQQLATLRTSQRCAACRTQMTVDPASDDSVRYDDRDLLVLHAVCGTCGAKKSIYVEPVTA